MTCLYIQREAWSGAERLSGLLNPLNAELNPIRHLLALAGAHHFVRVSRLRVNPAEKLGKEIHSRQYAICEEHENIPHIT